MFDAHTTEVFYRILSQVAGMPRAVAPCPHPTKKSLDLAMGWPDLKIAVAYEGDEKAVAAFRKSDWEVMVLSAQCLSSAMPFLKFVSDLTFQRKVRQSRIDAKQTVSRQESTLLEELLRCGLPDPDRDFSFSDPDGRCTVPDFVWHDERLAVFVDGWEWHGGRERREIIEEAVADPARAAQRSEGDRSRITRDAAVRRAMTAAGWRTITVTDQELTTADAVAATAFDIMSAFREARANQGVAGASGR